MTGETPFRLVLIAVALVQASISFWFLRGTGAGSTIFGRREEGLVLTAALSLCYLAYSAAVVVYFLNPDWIAWSAVALPSPVRWIGVVPLSLGAFWIIRAQKCLGRNITISISTKANHALITTGPYGWVRHPLYSAGMIESVGVCLLTANWFVTLSAGSFWALIAVRTPMEERKLIEKFGSEYRAYVQRVGRFVPRLKRRH